MKFVEAVAVLLAIGLMASVAINIWQHDSAQQLAASLSPFNEPLVLDNYSITEDAITLVFWNREVASVQLSHECEGNGWNPTSFSQSASVVPPNGTVTITVDGPIECHNASYEIRFHYQCGSGEFIFERTIPRGNITYEPAVTLDQAIAIGREFLDSRNFTTGAAGGSLAVMEPNDYWHSWFGIPNGAQPGFQHCWRITYEKACCPGHYFLLWVNSETGEVIGGSQCL